MQHWPAAKPLPDSLEIPAAAAPQSNDSGSKKVLAFGNGDPIPGNPKTHTILSTYFDV